MFSQALKKELFPLVERYISISSTIARIERESEKTVDQLFDEYGEYAELHLEQDILRQEIDEILVQARFSPLTGISSEQGRLMRLFRRESRKYPNIGLSKINGISIPVPIHYSPHAVRTELLEQYLQLEQVVHAEGFLSRLKKVKPIVLGGNVGWRPSCLYREAVSCYVNGLFVASIALCRSAAEALTKQIAEERIEAGSMPRGDGVMDKLIRMLKGRRLLAPSTADYLFKVKALGNEALHGNPAAITENHAITALRLLRQIVISITRKHGRRQKK